MEFPSWQDNVWSTPAPTMDRGFWMRHARSNCHSCKLFNRSRVMVLPQGVSKATGLHAALDMLRLSARNTLAIGDAENDHELLRIAEIGVAVSWGSAALQSVADLVVTGGGATSVASFLRPLAASANDACAGASVAPPSPRIHGGRSRVLSCRPLPLCSRRRRRESRESPGWPVCCANN